MHSLKGMPSLDRQSEPAPDRDLKATPQQSASEHQETLTMFARPARLRVGIHLLHTVETKE